MFGDEGASEGDEEAATTDAGAESEPSAAEFAGADKEDVAGEANFGEVAPLPCFHHRVGGFPSVAVSLRSSFPLCDAGQPRIASPSVLVGKPGMAHASVTCVADALAALVTHSLPPHFSSLLPAPGAHEPKTQGAGHTRTAPYTDAPAQRPTPAHPHSTLHTENARYPK